MPLRTQFQSDIKEKFVLKTTGTQNTDHVIRVGNFWRSVATADFLSQAEEGTKPGPSFEEQWKPCLTEGSGHGFNFTAQPESSVTLMWWWLLSHLS